MQPQQKLISAGSITVDKVDNLSRVESALEWKSSLSLSRPALFAGNPDITLLSQMSDAAKCATGSDAKASIKAPSALPGRNAHRVKQLAQKDQCAARNLTAWHGCLFEIPQNVSGKQPMKTIVKVWDKDYEITVDRRSKTVWIAVGEYMGERIDVKGSSERDAVGRWCEAARYMGNLGVMPPKSEG